jgi:hypothetical protein
LAGVPARHEILVNRVFMIKPEVLLFEKFGKQLFLP